MCYCDFDDILDAIAELDADVISIEASRSDMDLLEAFQQFRYPNDIGPGVYDIHSPRVPEVDEIVGRLRSALVRLRPEQLWVNPDCGLKTRGWPEVRAALAQHGRGRPAGPRGTDRTVTPFVRSNSGSGRSLLKPTASFPASLSRGSHRQSRDYGLPNITYMLSLAA